MAALKRYTVVIHWKDAALEPLKVEHVLAFYMNQWFLKADIAHDHSRFWFAHEVAYVDEFREQTVLAS